MDQSFLARELSFKELVTNGRKLADFNSKTIVVLCFAFTIIASIVNLFAPDQHAMLWERAIFSFTADLIPDLTYWLGLSFIIKASLAGENISSHEVLRSIVRKFPNAVKTEILAMFYIFSGFLLILPGIKRAIDYLFTTYLVAFDGLSGGQALASSKAIVNGKRWVIFGYVLCFKLATLAICALVGVPLYLVFPQHVLQIHPISEMISLLGTFLAVPISCGFIVFFLNRQALLLKPSSSEALNSPSSEPPLPREPLRLGYPV